MNETYKYIFDMDGTLYQFDDSKDQTFTSSRFNQDLKRNVQGFISDRLGISPSASETEYKRIYQLFNGEMSLGIEKEYGISRSEYFTNTWNLSPEDYITKNPLLPEMLGALQGRAALLTAAPRIWATRVLSFLDIDSVFGEMVFTGEPDERKPNPVVFQNIATVFNENPKNIFSIGDQEDSDILPAKQVGMRTVRIGSSETAADYSAENILLAIQFIKGVS